MRGTKVRVAGLKVSEGKRRDDAVWGVTGMIEEAMRGKVEAVRREEWGERSGERGERNGLNAMRCALWPVWGEIEGSADLCGLR